MKKKTSEEYKKEIPDSIKILYGKFILLSLIMIVFLGIIFPLILVNKISLFSKIGILVVLFLFYIYAVVDVIRKRKKFGSTTFALLIFITLLTFGICIYKIID